MSKKPKCPECKSENVVILSQGEMLCKDCLKAFAKNKFNEDKK